MERGEQSVMRGAGRAGGREGLWDSERQASASGLQKKCWEVPDWSFIELLIMIRINIVIIVI